MRYLVRRLIVHSVFVDGSTGTTGLDVMGRLDARDDLCLIRLEEKERRSLAARLGAMRSADVSVLCLPDEAAGEVAHALQGEQVRLLDASTRHRTASGWIFGLPELDPRQRSLIASATRVSNPGCYSTGFILSVRPLVDAGVIGSQARICVHAVSGYSGGGKGMIQRYQASTADLAVRSYALTLNHKHQPEMRVYARLDHDPLFSPMVGNYYKGMITQVPLFREQLTEPASRERVHELLMNRYQHEPFVQVHPLGDTTGLDQGQLAPDAANDTNRVDLFVFGSDERMLLTARFDNLGKGACGAAMQNLNLMLGIEESRGLNQ